jgi:hypothetical protein
MSRPRKLSKAAHTALQAVLYRESQCKAFQVLVEQIYHDHGNRQPTSQLSSAIDVISDYFVNKSLEAHRNLLLWMHVTPESLPEELRVAVVNKFVGSGKMIMHRLKTNLVLPSQWKADDEDQFRAEIDEWISSNLPPQSTGSEGSG